VTGALLAVSGLCLGFAIAVFRHPMRMATLGLLLLLSTVAGVSAMLSLALVAIPLWIMLRPRRSSD